MLLPDWLNSIYLGVVEGLTEFIPVSSTAHLLIAEDFTKQRESDVFNIVVQSGAVLALVPLFWQRGVSIIKGALTSGVDQRKNLDFILKLLLAFVITGVGGLIMVKRGYKLPTELAPVGWALLIGGFVILAVEWWSKGRKLSDDITWTLAVAFGLSQLIAAAFPGASRSGSTIMLAMILGMSRPAATEFSFMLGVPTLLASGAYELLKQLHPHAGQVVQSEHVNWLNVAIGTVVAFLVSLVVVRWLIHFVQGHTFNGFAVYRIAAGALVLLYLAAHP